MRFIKRNKPARQVNQSGKKPAYIYYSSRQKGERPSPFEKPLPKKVRSRPKIITGFIDAAIILAVLVGLVYSLIVKPTPKILASSTAYHPVKIYQAAAAKQLQNFKNRNKVTLDENAISSALRKQFPEIASLKIELPLFSQVPNVHLNIAAPSLILESGGALYLVDAEGVSVAKAAQWPALGNLPHVIDQTGFSLKAGQPVLSASAVGFIKALASQCQRAGVPISSLSLPPLAQELDLRTADSGYFVKFYLGGEVLQQSGQFLATRHGFNTSHIQPAEYLDVRVPGKIFYK